MNKKICIIIPTHGAGDAFIDCLNSIIGQTISPVIIIIVNNNVQDGSIEKFFQQHSITQFSGKINNINIQTINCFENTGVTGGRNTGIDNLPLDYDFVCFVDHDMVAKPSLLQNLQSTLEKDNNIGIVTPKIFYWDNKDIIWSAGTDINLTTGQTIFYGGKDLGQYDQEKEVAIAPAIFLVKKSVIDSIKHFDEKYFATYEDTDFCFQAKRKGYKIFYNPKAIAYHKIPYDPTLAMNRLLERSYWVGRNRYLFLRKFKYFTLTTILFIPVYFMYYAKLGVQYKNLSSIKNYIHGVIDGLSIKI
ncbi:MAG: glycosyltransferase family 2 protein [bacterium]|nr:glycosyltransferase family 2 protein [bacterium]